MKSLKTSLLLLVIFCSITLLRAQHKSDTVVRETHQGLYAYGGIGPAIPVGKYGQQRSIGFDLNTAIEYRFVSGFMVRGMFDFSSFVFERGTVSQVSNGKTYDLSGSNNLVTLAISGGYAFEIGRFAPYLFAGFGASFLSKPDISVNEQQNYVDTGLLVKGYLSTVSGMGVDFVLSPVRDTNLNAGKARFIIYLEGFHTFIPSITETSIHRFNLVSVNIGIKSKF